MTESELIAKQQLEIEELKNELELAKMNLGQIRMYLIACGGLAGSTTHCSTGGD